MRRNWKSILFLGIILLTLFSFFYLGLKRSVKIKVEEIGQEYNGVVVRKYAIRDYTEPTHLDIRTNFEIISVTPNYQIVDVIEVGDSIVKPKNENYVIVISPDGESSSYFYTRLSYKTRKSRWFPKQWKDKWLNSSQWDSINKK